MFTVIEKINKMLPSIRAKVNSFNCFSGRRVALSNERSGICPRPRDNRFHTFLPRKKEIDMPLPAKPK